MAWPGGSPDTVDLPLHQINSQDTVDGLPIATVTDGPQRLMPQYCGGPNTIRPRQEITSITPEDAPVQPRQYRDHHVGADPDNDVHGNMPSLLCGSCHRLLLHRTLIQLTAKTMLNVC
ncbi:unnamed protein product [Leptidea sinapis]|uniref:Uncharacterized protein n=1 Tax=Leptidea sinapis TaxID=189913 RepID=A0A5E4Q284_9NEOP|nr:unnamed protein product [Leptidea sinapis]